MGAIEIESLTKTYGKRRGPPLKAVDGLTLSVPPGQVLAFLGPNGAGKTTTIKMMCGLVTPTAGRILLSGCDVARERGAAMRQVGAVLEGTRNVYWRLSAWENLTYFGRLKGIRGRELKGRAERLLRALDLWDRRNDAVGDFSRGMQQKVSIACALIADPPIVLLDEPTLGLDVRAARTVKRWVDKLAHEEGKTVLLTTHQLDMAQEVSDRVAIMHRGRLIADQPTSELLSLFRGDTYQIRVKGHLNGARAEFDGMTIVDENGTTLLSGEIVDQGELHSLLDKIQRLRLPLLSVTLSEPDLEETFVRLTSEKD